MERKNAWKTYSEEDISKLNAISAEYVKFLDNGKTERECVAQTVEIMLFKIGKQPIFKGLNIVGAHIDSPRIDLKQNPLYEDTDFAYLDTHYYGGIKKYQWVAMPLAMHGVVAQKDGTLVNIVKKNTISKKRTSSPPNWKLFPPVQHAISVLTAA